MTELVINDFKLGLDVRRNVLTAPPGSLQTLDNCVVNAGGEIEKRAAFVKISDLPAGLTFGLLGSLNQIHVFGMAAPPVINQGTSPFPIVYHQLAPIAGKTIQIILNATVFQGKFMVSAQFTDGSAANWFDGVQVNIGLEGDLFRLFQAKMYRTTGGPLLRFSGVDNPTINDPADVNYPGAGFIDLSSQDSDSEVCQGMEVFYKQMAIFSRLATQLWSLDPDPAKNAIQQVVRIGAMSPHSIRQFGTGDVLFLADSGVRSLRAINASMAAAINDVGSPIDKLLTAEIANDFPTAAYLSRAIVQPITGRYWLAIGSKIYVLSYYPSAKISAWSTFSSNLPVDEMSTVQNRVIFRSGDGLYMYGGPDGTVYDNTQGTVVTPMMSADSPTLWKKPISIDLMIKGQWTLNAGMMAQDATLRELVGTFAGQTYSLQAIPYAGYGTHIGFTLTTTDPSPALLGSITVNFQKADLK